MIGIKGLKLNEIKIMQNHYFYPISAPPQTSEHTAPGTKLRANTSVIILKK